MLTGITANQHLGGTSNYTAMSPKDSIAEAYRNWLGAVNRRDSQGTSKLLSDNIIHNGNTFNKDDYIQRITDTLTESSTDHTITLDMLTVNNDGASLASVSSTRPPSQNPTSTPPSRGTPSNGPNSSSYGSTPPVKSPARKAS